MRRSCCSSQSSTVFNMRMSVVASVGMPKACCHDLGGSTWGFSALGHDSAGVHCEATTSLTFCHVTETVLTEKEPPPFWPLCLQ